MYGVAELKKGKSTEQEEENSVQGRPSTPNVHQNAVRRARMLWDRARQKFVHQTREINALALLSAKKAIPYALSMKQGFIFKYRLKVKHNIVTVLLHPRAPKHHTEGRGSSIKSGPQGVDINGQKDSDEYDDDNGDDVHRKIKRVTPVTFACVDSLGMVRLWDISRHAPTKPRIYNARLDLIKTFHTPHNVQFVKTSKQSPEFVTIGSHQIIVWNTSISLHSRTGAQFELTQRLIIHTHLSEGDWITGFLWEEKRQRFFAVATTNILVYDSLTGKELDRWIHLSQRQIVNITYYELYDYAIIGCIDGTVKIINMTGSIVHEFRAHTKTITALSLYPHLPVVVSSSLDCTLRMLDLKSFQEVY
ncbi:hypothetical protein HDU76_012463, partial [Blyttiomyces sp. JEL0837]